MIALPDVAPAVIEPKDIVAQENPRQTDPEPDRKNHENHLTPKWSVHRPE